MLAGFTEFLSDITSWMMSNFVWVFIPLVLLGAWKSKHSFYDTHIRGPQLVTLPAIKRELRRLKLQPPRDRLVVWGGLEIPIKRLHPHFMFMGVSRSGKSMSILMLIHSAMLKPHPDKPKRILAHRGLFFDLKTDTYETLKALGVEEHQIHWVNPWDARGSQWDIAKDVPDENSAMAVGALLAPPDKEARDPYWGEVTRQLVGGVLDALRVRQQRNGTPWSLIDVVNAFETQETLKPLMQFTRLGLVSYQTYLEKNYPGTASSVWSNIRSKILNLRIPARMWAANPDMRPFSIREWLYSPADIPTVIIIYTIPEFKTALQPINNVLFSFATIRLLSTRRSHPVDETWFVLDEPHAAGKQEHIADLVNSGAEMGLHVVMSLLDTEGFESIYARGVGSSIRQQFGNVSIHQLTNVAAQQWASKAIGIAEVERTTFGSSETISKQPSSTRSRGVNVAQKPLVTEGELGSLSMASVEPKPHMEGIYLSTISPNRWRCVWPDKLLAKWWKPRAIYVQQASIEPPDVNYLPPDDSQPNQNPSSGPNSPFPQRPFKTPPHE